MPLTEFDALQLRKVLGSFATGVTVITTVDASGKLYGLTANSFTSVSLDPPLVLWNQALSAPSHPVFRDAQRFGVSILAEHQIDISQRFARKSENKFDGVDYVLGLGGVPLITGCAATLECRLVATHIGGDHAVFIGQVDRIDSSERHSLVFARGKYMVAHPHYLGELSNDLADDGLTQVRAVRVATPVVCELAAQLDETLAISVWTPQGPTVVRWEPSSHPPTTRLNMGAVSIPNSATGRLFAAHLPAERSTELVRGESLASGVATDLTDVSAEIRAQGHSIIEMESDAADGVPLVAISVPVFGASGEILLAITSLSRADARPAKELLMKLQATAKSLSQRLGFSA